MTEIHISYTLDLPQELIDRIKDLKKQYLLLILQRRRKGDKLRDAIYRARGPKVMALKLLLNYGLGLSDAHEVFLAAGLRTDKLGELEVR